MAKASLTIGPVTVDLEIPAQDLQSLDADQIASRYLAHAAANALNCLRSKDWLLGQYATRIGAHDNYCFDCIELEPCEVAQAITAEFDEFVVPLCGVSLKPVPLR